MVPALFYQIKLIKEKKEVIKIKYKSIFTVYKNKIKHKKWGS